MVTTRPALLPVHPRASGENYNDDFDDEDDSGSSPRERGKRVLATHKMFMPRLIPA